MKEPANAPPVIYEKACATVAVRLCVRRYLRDKSWKWNISVPNNSCNLQFWHTEMHHAGIGCAQKIAESSKLPQFFGTSVHCTRTRSTRGALHACTRCASCAICNPCCARAVHTALHVNAEVRKLNHTCIVHCQCTNRCVVHVQCTL